MSNPRYPEEFKIQAVKQVTEKQLPVSEVAARLGVWTCPYQIGHQLPVKLMLLPSA